MTKRRTLIALIALPALAASACTGGGGGSENPSELSMNEFPRNETLYITGTGGGPPADWNTITPGEVTGLNGLGYETLFLFDPETTELDPWLAETGEWTGDLTYQLTLRDGITWSDGEQLTADDVKYTAELGQIEAVPYHNIWEWLESVEVVDDLTVEFTFAEARHQEWNNFLWAEQIVPEHVLSQLPEEEILTGANEDPVVSGPYTVHSYDQDRLAWVKRDDWWATDHLDLEVQPTFVVEVITTSNEVALNLVAQGEVDLSNNFLPGIQDLMASNPDLSTYHDEAPYMQQANTAMLIPNTTVEPLDDPEFRKAMASAVDGQKIVDSVYSGIVATANPTGLLPLWDDYIDQSVIDEHGISYGASEAASILSAAGYEDGDGDGFVENTDGEAVELTLNVPTGWTDWEEAARSMAADLQAAGINVTEEFIDAGAVDDARTSGDFEIIMNNWSGISHTPWTHYRYLFQLPVLDDQSTANFSRWENEEAWSLTEELAATASDDPRYQEILSDLQRISLEEMPAIPVWYNGAWSQVNNAVWTNWPSEADDTPNVIPTAWNGYWNMSSIYMLTELEPAG
ncbi:ABC transporter substrate-binding protein [Glycomyces sp. L485]|uniref:ABC transporter substrate-binding protein n=1 Tax=Glycomyces sp. L485 TaxID=2909235 RepID=UPI001F4B0598|nr:ABC transporter substrate-binding protein [Glycomyces sp. L485]MCH7231478.1 ABC transporter substrate-binding protein [Glycomyces sp. L485]